MLPDARIKQIEAVRGLSRTRTPEELYPLLSQAVDDLLAEREELLAENKRLREASKEAFAEVLGNSNTTNCDAAGT